MVLLSFSLSPTGTPMNLFLCLHLARREPSFPIERSEIGAVASKTLGDSALISTTNISKTSPSSTEHVYRSLMLHVFFISTHYASSSRLVDIRTTPTTGPPHVPTNPLPVCLFSTFSMHSGQIQHGVHWTFLIWQSSMYKTYNRALFTQFMTFSTPLNTFGSECQLSQCVLTIGGPDKANPRNRYLEYSTYRRNTTWTSWTHWYCRPSGSSGIRCRLRDPDSFPRRYSRHMYHPNPVRIYSWAPQLWCHKMAIIPRIKGGALLCNFSSFRYRKTTNPSIYWVWRLPITFKPFPKTAGAPHWIRSLCSWRQRFCILHGAFFSS